MEPIKELIKAFVDLIARLLKAILSWMQDYKFIAGFLVGFLTASFMGCSIKIPLPPEPSPSPTATPTPGPTVTPTPAPTATPSPDPTPGPSPTPEPSPEPTPEPTPDSCETLPADCGDDPPRGGDGGNIWGCCSKVQSGPWQFDGIVDEALTSMFLDKHPTIDCPDNAASYWDCRVREPVENYMAEMRARIQARGICAFVKTPIDEVIVRTGTDYSEGHDLVIGAWDGTGKMGLLNQVQCRPARQ